VAAQADQMSAITAALVGMAFTVVVAAAALRSTELQQDKGWVAVRHTVAAAAAALAWEPLPIAQAAHHAIRWPARAADQLLPLAGQHPLPVALVAAVAADQGQRQAIWDQLADVGMFASHNGKGVIMSRYAVIKSGVVINVIEADAEFAATVGGVLSDAASPGDNYQDGIFTKPVVQIKPPEVVTMRQARLALLGAGVLDTADAAISAMTGIEGQAARIEWEYAHEIRRDSPLVTAMSAMLGLDAAALDALFVAANGL
jgi:hypothetical protein